MIFETADFDPKLKAWADLVSKLQICMIFMKFGTQNKLNMLIMNIVLGIDNLGPKLYRFRQILSQHWNLLRFL